MIDLLRKMWSSFEGFFAVHSILGFLKLSLKLLIDCGQFWFCHENMTSFSDLTSFRSMEDGLLILIRVMKNITFILLVRRPAFCPFPNCHQKKEWLQKECDFKNPLLFKILRIFLEICSKDNVRVEFGLFFKKILISKDYFWMMFCSYDFIMLENDFHKRMTELAVILIWFFSYNRWS